MKNRRKEYIHAFYENNHVAFIGGIIFTFLRSAVYILISTSLGIMVDAMINPETESITGYLVPMMLLIVMSSIFSLGVFICKSRFIHQALRQFKKLVFSKMVNKSFRAFSKENTARYLSVFSNDMKSIEENYLNNIFLLIYQVTVFVFALIFVFVINYRLALFLVVVGCISLLFSGKLSQMVAVLEKNVSDENESFMAEVKDLVSGFSVLKSFKIEKEAQNIFDNENQILEEKKRTRRLWDGSLEVTGNAFSFLMQLGSFLYGAYLVLRGECTAGSVLSIVSLSNYIFQPVSYVPQLIGAFKAAGKLFDKIIDVVSENSDEQNGVEIHSADNIVLNDVSFSYDDSNEVLHHISCTFEKGKKYAIIGDSGSGKSTMLNLLMGAFDNYHGSLKVDETEMKDINSDSLFDEVSLIDQNVFLFDASIKDNITMFKDVEEEKLMDAIQKAGLSELVKNKGLDFVCGENGNNLSGGEKQRISIARSLIKGAPVLLLDEITSALDEKTAHAINQEIVSLKDKLCIEITHRLDESILKQYDKLLVLRNGRIEETGTFDELYNEKKYFYSLYTVSKG